MVSFIVFSGTHGPPDRVSRKTIIQLVDVNFCTSELNFYFGSEKCGSCFSWETSGILKTIWKKNNCQQSIDFLDYRWTELNHSCWLNTMQFISSPDHQNRLSRWNPFISIEFTLRALSKIANDLHSYLLCPFCFLKWNPKIRELWRLWIFAFSITFSICWHRLN